MERIRAFTEQLLKRAPFCNQYHSRYTSDENGLTIKISITFPQEDDYVSDMFSRSLWISYEEIKDDIWSAQFRLYNWFVGFLTQYIKYRLEPTLENTDGHTSFKPYSITSYDTPRDPFLSKFKKALGLASVEGAVSDELTTSAKHDPLDIHFLPSSQDGGILLDNNVTFKGDYHNGFKPVQVVPDMVFWYEGYLYQVIEFNPTSGQWYCESENGMPLRLSADHVLSLTSE